jgi:cytochrome c peroxidase
MVKRLSIASSGLTLLMAGCVAGGATDDTTVTSALVAANNPAGTAETVTTTGTIDRTGTFFQPLGTNARTCETCHSADQGWTMTTTGVTKLFLTSQGLAPLFNPVDEGARPDEDLSSFFSRFTNFAPTLLALGVTRFTRTNPATSEYNVTAVSDPSGFYTTTSFLNFRRPTSAANEALTSSVTNTAGPGTVLAALQGLVVGAANLHEQRQPPSVPTDQVNAQVAFQLSVFFAQTIDKDAGRLDADGAMGGPTNLMAQPFHIGINDIQGNDPAGQPFSPKVFNIFDAWAVYAQNSDHDHSHGYGCNSSGPDDQNHRDHIAEARASIYRGQEIFNNLQFNITGVHGLNDVLGQTTVVGTCSTCHNAPNVGGHSVVRMFDVGTADRPNCNPALPLVTVQNKTTNETRTVCDLGRAAGSHLWADIGGFRAPPLRGLAARAPYFHDGQARTIDDAVGYFDRRFQIGLHDDQKQDLVAFLRAL